MISDAHISNRPGTFSLFSSAGRGIESAVPKDTMMDEVTMNMPCQIKPTNIKARPPVEAREAEQRQQRERREYRHADIEKQPA
ncbi:hypothetical protein [Paraburkholderia sp. BCC1876]|uniref:hypothetical protein n=1 Tax=Paraburkholderia sp. BCC1876 TaxID=2676303 RepID=UPI00158FE63C|nr:hypothetical protein [Paraburkholderia sp. BCC1876]